MKYTVYCHTNKINNKKYIGITSQKVEERWRNGKGYSTQPKFYNAICKYGWDNFTHEILISGLDEQEAIELEINLIKSFNTIKNGYNTYSGGNVTHHSTETKQKIRHSHQGMKMTAQACDNIRKAKIEKTGQKVKCVETNRIYLSLGEAARDTGIDKTSLSRCCHGKQITAGKYHWVFVEQDIKINTDKRKRKVQCIDTGIIYDSVSAAAAATNSDISNISKVCNGKYKTTNKLRWRWVEEDA